MLDETRVATPGSPEWRLLRLGQQLTNDMPRMNKLAQYDCGDHPLPIGHKKMRETYRRFQRMSRSNYTGLVAEAVRERLRPQGIASGADGSRSLDKTAWAIWQANSLDAECKIAFHKALVFGRAYLMAAPNPKDKSKPYITVEDPRQVIHEPDPMRPREVVAALKTWFDAMRGAQLAVVHIRDDGHYYFVSSASRDNISFTDVTQWSVDESMYGGFAANTLDGKVPVFPMVNRRERDPMGMGEFEDVLDIQDRINASQLDRLVIQAMQAYRQRWAKGLNVKSPDGNTEAPFDPGADLLWVVGGTESKDAQFGSFEAADISQIVTATSSDVRDMSAVTRTPPHYLLASVQNIAADALAAVESGHTNKVRDRQVEFGETLEDSVRGAGGYAGVEIPDDATIVWNNPERYSLAAASDAMVKWEAAGVPFDQRMQLVFDQQTIDRMRAQREADAEKAAAQSLSVMPGALAGATTEIVQPLGPNAVPQKPTAAPAASKPATPPAKRPAP